MVVSSIVFSFFKIIQYINYCYIFNNLLACDKSITSKNVDMSEGTARVSPDAKQSIFESSKAVLSCSAQDASAGPSNTSQYLSFCARLQINRQYFYKKNITFNF